MQARSIRSRIRDCRPSICTQCYDNSLVSSLCHLTVQHARQLQLARVAARECVSHVAGCCGRPVSDRCHGGWQRYEHANCIARRARSPERAGQFGFKAASDVALLCAPAFTDYGIQAAGSLRGRPPFATATPPHPSHEAQDARAASAQAIAGGGSIRRHGCANVDHGSRTGHRRQSINPLSLVQEGPISAEAQVRWLAAIRYREMVDGRPKRARERFRDRTCDRSDSAGGVSIVRLLLAASCI